jgi:hypothetical protein
MVHPVSAFIFRKINYGCIITNVGCVDIPTAYGDLQLEAVYGPLVYSDVNEKTIGVIAVGNGAKIKTVEKESSVEVCQKSAEMLNTQRFEHS